MGNASSSGGRGHHDESVDYGSLAPQGVYTGPRDWNHAIVSQLIVARKLAPFYRPLEDYEESWDDDQILAARKELSANPENPEHPTRSDSVHSMSSKSNSKRSVANREQQRPDAAVYRGAVECPICFLYYPPNINHSRCCDQAICTECFVQIKRNEPTTTHLVSEPTACPYCVQDNFGVVYRPPQWRAGIGSDGSTSQWPEPPRESNQAPTHKRRQKSYSADSPEVVTTDQIRPDWEAKLAAVRAAVARRANRRIIMRQVGDRLIPVGVTSGRVHALNPEEAGAEVAEGGGSRRRRRHGGSSQLEQFMSIPGQDLEELMLMEAMRLSLIEHEEQQRKEAEEKRKQAAAAAAAAAAAGNFNGGNSPSGPTSGPQTTGGTESSTSAAAPSNLSIPSSSQASLAPVSASPASRQSNESSETEQRKSRSHSRSRSSPPPSNHETNTESSAASWNHRTPNPPPFSALNAALVSASTATAILGSSPPRQSQETGSTDNNTSSRAEVPSIIVVHDDNAQQDLSNTPPASTNHTEERPPLPPKPTPTRASVASVKTSTSSIDDSANHHHDLDDSHYGHLPSSPDSEVVHEPLLAALNQKSRAADTESTRSGTSVQASGSMITTQPDG
ncbi:Protein sip-5 [Leucoagaricus sp. SymC.cos]|nr:Protein sip-5 [Leucoagaricus sp. SymC.cos]